MTWITMAESRRRLIPRLNETVASLRMATSDASSPEALARAVMAGGPRLTRPAAERIARAVWYRYCAPDPLAYPEIGDQLGITPQHARRLATRGLGYLQGATVRPKRGSRLERAIREGRVL